MKKETLGKIGIRILLLWIISAIAASATFLQYMAAHFNAGFSEQTAICAAVAFQRPIFIPLCLLLILILVPRTRRVAIGVSMVGFFFSLIGMPTLYMLAAKRTVSPDTMATMLHESSLGFSFILFIAVAVTVAFWVIIERQWRHTGGPKPDGDGLKPAP